MSERLIVEKGDDYVCAWCKGEFTATQSHEEASAECKLYFDATPDDIDCDVVCDDCWNKIVEDAERLNASIAEFPDDPSAMTEEEKQEPLGLMRDAMHCSYPSVISRFAENALFALLEKYELRRRV